MATVKMTMYFDVPNEEDAQGLKQLEHHADYILNLDEYPEIESVYGVKVQVLKSR